jgi:hypothetical protein
MREMLEIAKEVELEWLMHNRLYKDHLQRFAELVRADEREACLNCYSPDDTVMDWADKIKARGNA